MMKITGLSHIFKWENLHNWWLTKYFFAPLYYIDLLHIVKYFKPLFQSTLHLICFGSISGRTCTIGG